MDPVAAASPPALEPLRIDIWSDVACPWCWLGYAHLRRAADEAGVPIEVTFRAFQLTPQQSVVEPVATYLRRKYGDMSRIAASQERLCEMGARVGIPYDFDQALASNTFDAHRLHHFAQAQGRGEQIMQHLFAAQHAHGAALSDHALLQAVGEAGGLPPDAVASVLATDAHADSVRQDIEAARRLGVQGVPFFVIEGRLALSGAQPVEVFEQALRQVQTTS